MILMSVSIRSLEFAVAESCLLVALHYRSMSMMSLTIWLVVNHAWLEYAFSTYSASYL